MSRLLDFYRGQSTDSEGRFLKGVWGWNDERLEEVHDFIQWLFPLTEPSRFNPDAPLLTPEDIAAFHADPLLRANLQKSFERMLTFLGLSWAGDGTVGEGPHFAAREPEVWSFPNHNWLRITRILHSLKLLGLEPAARNLYARLAAYYRAGKYPIPTDTFRYWTEAVEGRP